MLPREEYIEQAYFFHVLRERMQQDHSTQDLLVAVGQEVLATTRLPYAIEFMTVELKHTGGFATAMARLPHYFTAFQTYVVAEAEREQGRFDFRVGLEVLEREAEYRTKDPTPAGMFIFQFETLCRNRLGYDHGLDAIAADPIYDEAWRDWIRTVRRQIGLIDFADMVYGRSELNRKHHGDPGKPILFGEKEGRIAMANRRKDPLYLFSALQRHLGYPSVPRTKPEDKERFLLPALQRRVERLETRIRLLEEELRGGINLARFYKQEDRKGRTESGGAEP